MTFLGELSTFFRDGDDLVGRTLQLPADVRDDRRYSGVAFSSVQSSAAVGKDRHSFVTHDSSSPTPDIYHEAIMKNSSVAFLRRDEAEMRMVFDRHVEYPEGQGCRASYLQPGFRDTSLFVAFENCVPLRIHIYSSPFTSEQTYHDLLQGRKVIVLAAQDAYGEEDVFYAYINDGNDVEFISVGYGDLWALPATDIGSCSVVKDLHSLSTSANTSTLDVIVDCLDSANNEQRYLVYGIYNEGIDRDFAVSMVEGEPHTSEDGAFLAQLQEGNVYSLFVYEVASILSTPAQINFMEPFTIKFLQSGDLTILVILREGEDVEMIDVPLFTSSHGLQGRVSIPGATITSCDQCTAVEIIAGNVLMISVWNPDTLFYDLLYVELESDSLTPSCIPQVSSEPLVFSFVQFPVELTSTAAESTETESSTETSTAESAETNRGQTTSSEKESPTSPLTHPGAIAGWVVALLLILCLVIGATVCACWHKPHKKGNLSKHGKRSKFLPPPVIIVSETSAEYLQGKDGVGLMTPKSATSLGHGEIVTAPMQVISKPMHAQETAVQADDNGYMTSSTNSQPSTRTPTPQGTPLADCRQ